MKQQYQSNWPQHLGHTYLSNCQIYYLSLICFIKLAFFDVQPCYWVQTYCHHSQCFQGICPSAKCSRLIRCLLFCFGQRSETMSSVGNALDGLLVSMICRGCYLGHPLILFGLKTSFKKSLRKICLSYLTLFSQIQIPELVFSQ